MASQEDDLRVEGRCEEGWRLMLSYGGISYCWAYFWSDKRRAGLVWKEF
jgi:hypothetical protein